MSSMLHRLGQSQLRLARVSAAYGPAVTVTTPDGDDAGTATLYIRQVVDPQPTPAGPQYTGATRWIGIGPDVGEMAEDANDRGFVPEGSASAGLAVGRVVTAGGQRFQILPDIDLTRGIVEVDLERL